MGFLKNIVKQGINEGISKSLQGAGEGISKGIQSAVGKAVEKAVAPAAEKWANSTAEQINQATAQTSATMQEVNAAPRTGSRTNLSGAFANLEQAMQGYATEMSKSIKICPACGEAATADRKFCPACGAQLPEQTVAEGAVCPKCGKQNTIGTRFCAECGEKLPYALQEDAAAAENDAAELKKWQAMLPQYPQWACGGSDYHLEDLGGYYGFTACFATNAAAEAAVEQYRGLLQQAGFRPAGAYPEVYHLYKMINGSCYHADTEHCFEGDSNAPTVYFNIAEPTGGFNYVKPAEKQAPDLKDLKNAADSAKSMFKKFF